MDHALADELIAFFERYLSFYKDFLQLETNKLEGITQNQFEKINQCVKEEEVFMLKSRGLEIERDRFMVKVGSPNATFRELIDFLDPAQQAAQRKRAEDIYQELSQALLDLKETNHRCNNLTEIRLRLIQSAAEKLDKHSELRNMYTSKAYNDGKLTGILSKKI